MRDSLIERLRGINRSFAGNYELLLTCEEAADRIEDLEAELGSLRAQLADLRDAALHERGIALPPTTRSTRSCMTVVTVMTS
jgi:hypothetical protein